MIDIQKYINEIQEAQTKEWSQMEYDMNKIPTFNMMIGKKFARITRTSFGQMSAHCFVDIETGDIYKCASWKIPAKGIRGNINNEKKPLLGYDYYR